MHIVTAWTALLYNPNDCQLTETTIKSHVYQEFYLLKNAILLFQYLIRYGYQLKRSCQELQMIPIKLMHQLKCKFNLLIHLIYQ